MAISYEKANVVDEVLPIIDLLREVQTKLDSIPRSVTAARQLRVIITKLEGWYQTHTSNVKELPVPVVDQMVAEVVDFIHKKYGNGH